MNTVKNTKLIGMLTIKMNYVQNLFFKESKFPPQNP